MGKWIEVFKTGEHIASNGTKKEYTEDDLDAIVAKYNGQSEHQAPLVIGHPKDNDPAYGWVKELKRVSQKMLAYVDQISESVIEANQRGEYKKVSIAIYPDGLLRHVGLLGAVPPAVKGLAPVAFVDGVEYSEYVWATDEWRMPIVGRLFSRLRDWWIEKYGLEEADKILSTEDINTLHDRIESNLINLPGPSPEYKEQEEEMDKELKELQAKFEKLTQDFADLQGKYTTLSNEHNALKEDRAKEQLAFAEAQKKQELATAKETFDSFCEGLIREGKVLAGEKDALVLEFEDTYLASKALSFSEGQKSLVDKFKDRLSARPVQIKPRERNFADRKPGVPVIQGGFANFSEISEKDLDIDKRAVEYQEKHPEATYEVAVEAVLSSVRK